MLISFPAQARARPDKVRSSSGPRLTPREDQPWRHRQPEGEEAEEECRRETGGDRHSDELERGHGDGFENPKPSRNHSKRPRQCREHEARKDWRWIDLKTEGSSISQSVPASSAMIASWRPVHRVMSETS